MKRIFSKFFILIIVLLSGCSTHHCKDMVDIHGSNTHQVISGKNKFNYVAPENDKGKINHLNTQYNYPIKNHILYQDSISGTESTGPR